MKTFTKILSLLLAVMMLLSLVACDKPEGSSKKDDDTIVGKWEGELSSEAMGAIMGMIEMDLEITTDVAMYFEFDEDGDGEMTFDKGDMEKFAKEIAELTLEYMADAYGMSEEDLLAGMTKEEYLDAAVEEMDVDVMNVDFTYTVDGNEITMITDDDGETVITFKFDNGDLVMTEAEEEGAEEVWDAMLPMTLERIK